MAYGKFYIYTLTDPDTGEIFYIGRSKDVANRVKSHKRESYKNITQKQHPLSVLFDIPVDWVSDDMAEGNREKLLWIHDILKRGKQPVVKIIDKWYAKNQTAANWLEAAWIAHHFLAGEPLQNKITSKRMKPKWYRIPPEEYIKRLKQGKPNE